PLGPFADAAEEADAIGRYLQLAERDIDRSHAESLDAMRETVAGRCFVFPAGFAWQSLNTARLQNETLVFAECALEEIPEEVLARAGQVIAVALTPDVRIANRAATARGLVHITALGAAHRAGDDIIFDPRTIAPTAEASDAPLAIAAALMSRLEAAPVFVCPAEPLPEAIPDAVKLGPFRDVSSGTVPFHDALSGADWDGAPPILLVLREDADIAAFRGLLAGLDARVLTLAPVGQRVRVLAGERVDLRLQESFVSFAANDPALWESVAEHRPAVIVADAHASLSGMPPVPLIAVGDGPLGELADIALPASPPFCETLSTRTPVSPPQRDRLRLMLVDAVREVGRRAAAPRRVSGGRTVVRRPPAPMPVSVATPPPHDTPGRGANRAVGPAIGASNAGIETFIEMPNGGPIAPRTALATARQPLPGNARLGTGRHGRLAQNDTVAMGSQARPLGPDKNRDGTTMAEARLKRHNPFATFWPFPGIALLVLLGAWLVYMGAIAEMADARTAYYGLCGVTVLVLLFALRKTGPDSPRRAGATGASAMGNLPKRSSIPDPAADAVAQARAKAGAVPLNARQRAMEARSSVAPLVSDGAADGIAAGQGSPSANGAPSEGAADSFGEGAGSGTAGTTGSASAQAPTGNEPAVALRAPPAVNGDAFDAKAAIQQLEALVNREKAERGAQIAKLEGAVSGGPGGLDETLRQYLTIAAFNNAMNQKVFPRIEQGLSKKLDEVLDPDALRTRLGLTAGDGEGGGGNAGSGVPEGAVAELRALIEKQGEEAASERDAMREEIIGARRLAEKAARGEGGAALSEADSDAIDELRAALQKDRAQVAALHESIAALSASLEALGAEGEGSGVPKDAAAPTAQSDVDALREALTTIIEQNQEIRAQQDALASRFEPSSPPTEATPDKPD
ncbi:MAG: hypothetical protein AAGF49_03345, partial [Pseudomonadota bacterium]